MKGIKKYALQLLLGIIVGAICGLCGAAFSKAVSLVTNVRLHNSWIIYLLPLASLVSVYIYKLCRVKSIGTTSVFDCVRTEQHLSPLLAPAVFCCTCISHLFGASSGREGAALQIGGGVADSFSKLFKIDEDSRHITVMCGMAALFSAVFGTPLAACVFVLEVLMTRLFLPAALPVLLSSVTAFFMANLLKIHPERFNVGVLPEFSFLLASKMLVITAAGIVVAYIFCKGLDLGKKHLKNLIKNAYVRIVVGGALTVALTLIIGSYDYNGGGIDVINRVFEGDVKYEAFALKILFTVICVAAGYRGGEIIPTLFIGATLGGALALILGLPIGFGAAIGMAVLFVCATKCPFATILLCCEMFGFNCIVFISPIAIIAFFAARYKGLYNNPKDLFTLLIKQEKA